MFNKQSDPVAQSLLEAVQRLSKQVAELKGERDYLNERERLVKQETKLREEIETLKIEKGRKEEEFARERREIEHATGLHRKQSEWERTKAVEEAQIKVREENLSLERQRFEDQMSFHKEQIKTEVDRLEKLMAGLMERLPTVKWEVRGNGAREKVGADE